MLFNYRKIKISNSYVFSNPIFVILREAPDPWFAYYRILLPLLQREGIFSGGYCLKDYSSNLEI